MDSSNAASELNRRTSKMRFPRTVWQRIDVFPVVSGAVFSSGGSSDVLKRGIFAHFLGEKSP
jgi:hypothetical protein